MENIDQKTIAFDLDDVLCYRDTEKNGIQKYLTCKPNYNMINIVNKCYDSGHIVVIYTARGMKIFNGNVNKIYNNLYILTKNQLDNWGVKHHELVMGKLHYDILIDDKVTNSANISTIEDILALIKRFNKGNIL